MAETLSLISIVLLISAAVCLAAAVVFWFAFKIPDVIEYLSGRSVGQAVENRKVKNKTESGNSHTAQEKETIVRKGTTAIHSDANSTVPLTKKNTTVALNNRRKATTCLNNKAFTEQKGYNAEALQPIGFTILDEAIFIHTDEVI